MTLHGIRTYGEWQKEVAPELALSDLVPFPLDYGYLNLLGFLDPWSRVRRVNWLAKEYSKVTTRSGVKRPCVVAHSFGTWLITELMLQHPESVKFDKIIFTASIVPREFDWTQLFDRGQVLHVHNEVATKDPWPVAASWVPWLDAGPSGRRGFTCSDHRLTEERSPRGHSVAAFTDHFQKWITLFKRPQLTSEDQETLREILEFIPPIVSRAVDVDEGSLRCNIFVQSEVEGQLVIPPGAHVNMLDASELAIAIPIGKGCAGKAFAERKPTIAILKDGWWGVHHLPAAQLKRVNRDLKWIISFPIAADDGQTAGVLCIDCVGTARSLAELGGPGGNERNDNRSQVIKAMYDDIACILPGISRCICDKLQNGSL